MENFKTNIMGTIRSQLDTLNIKQKLEDGALTIFCSRCRKKHPTKDYLLNNIKVCEICAENHEIESCPSLLGLQAIYKEVSEPMESIFQVVQ